MKKPSVSKSTQARDYEILSDIDYDVFFEIEILCDSARELVAKIGKNEKDVLTDTYLNQSRYLVETVLEYIRQPRKTNIHFCKQFDMDSYVTCKAIHLEGIGISQQVLTGAFTRFKEAVSFIFPKNEYPENLISLKSKIAFIEIVVTDLFYFEKKKLLPMAVSDSVDFGYEPEVLN